MESGEEHFCHIPFEWFLARCQLDVHRLGSVPCHLVSATYIDREKPEVHEPNRGRTDLTNTERNRSNAFDVLFGGVRLDYFQGGEHRSGMGVYAGNDAIGDIECELSVLYPIGYMVNKYIHRHDACC